MKHISIPSAESAVSFEPEKNLKKFQIIGYLGFFIYAIGALSVFIFSMTAIVLSLLPSAQSMAMEKRLFDNQILQANDLLTLGLLALLTVPVSVLWCAIFRRFHPEKLLTTKTATLLLTALILSLPAYLAGDEFSYLCHKFNFNLASDPSSLGGRMVESTLFWLWDALPLLGFFWVFRITVFLKQESDSTI